MEEHEESKMSERDRALAELFAQHAAARVIDALKNPRTADEVIDTWSDRVQKAVGRWAIRAVFYIFGAAVLISMLKTGAIERLSDWFSIPRK